MSVAIWIREESYYGSEKEKSNDGHDEGKSTSLLLRFAMPLFLGNLLQQFYNLVDTSIAGNLLGDGALAQIGATAALYSLITNFAFGMNNGLALGVSRNFGAGDQQGVKKSVCWMTCLSCFCSVVLTVAFLIFRKGLLQVMQIPDDVMDGALRYLTIILAGIPLTMLYNLEASLLQAVGNSVMPLVFLLFSSVLNVGLDFWFMGPLGLGVQGAASATVLAQGISAGIGLGYIVRYYPELRFSKNEFKVKKNFVIEMFFSGLSMGMMNAIYCIGSVILQSSINALGSVYIAAQVGGGGLRNCFIFQDWHLEPARRSMPARTMGRAWEKESAEAVGQQFFCMGSGGSLHLCLLLPWHRQRSGFLPEAATRR